MATEADPTAPREAEYRTEAERKELLAQWQAKLEEIRHSEPGAADTTPVPDAHALAAQWHKWSWRMHNALRIYCAWVDWHDLPDAERTHAKLYEMLWGAERDLGIRGM